MIGAGDGASVTAGVVGSDLGAGLVGTGGAAVLIETEAGGGLLAAPPFEATGFGEADFVAGAGFFAAALAEVVPARAGAADFSAGTAVAERLLATLGLAFASLLAGALADFFAAGAALAVVFTAALATDFAAA